MLALGCGITGAAIAGRSATYTSPDPAADLALIDHDGAVLLDADGETLTSET